MPRAKRRASVAYPARAQDGLPFDVRLTAAVSTLEATQIRPIRPQAVVAPHVGILRAFYRDRWQWGPTRLGQILLRATLRG